MPLVWKSPRIDEDTYALTFEANDLRKRTNIFTTPIVIFINGSLFDQDGSPSSGMMATLEEAYDNKPHSTAIATNLEEIAVFSSPYSTTERSFERISTSRALPALRVIAAAYLKYSLMIHSYIPAPDPEHDEDLILPEGPPIDPQDSLPTDQEILETRFRQSDFDLATLMRDRNRALQFLRWKDHVQKTQDKLVAHPGDNISAASNSFSRAVPELKPYYPFKLSDLSADTVGHLTSIQRVCPLSVGSLRERLHHSKQLSLRILGVASKGSGGGICTVYRCQLTSIDGKDVTSPDLCLKLFDDRFQRLELPDEYESEENPARWFDRIVLAELHLRQEDAAYKKLSAVQGSIVPWYYGSHLFTLPSGLKLYGILLEYITGLLLDSDDVGKLSPERQIQLIQSCRHGARVLDIADIAQHDWHPHQILVHSLPETDTMHAVLLDFASTTQTIDPAIFTYLSNFHSCLAVLTGALGKVAVNRDLAIDHFGTPDYWDPVMTIVPRGPGRDSKVFESPDPFPFIHKS
ncbi:hypothetical protein FRC16_004276 [Serendipita sp. 398]|nr:hypothetical protein FRC16_004276 [Serendipita sp. 398]